jgi:hypothetical protein
MEQSYFAVTGNPLQVSAKQVNPAVERAVKRYLEMKHPDIQFEDKDIVIREVK